MIIAKKKRVTVRAAKLGGNDPLIKELIREGKLRRHHCGVFELMSREAIAGSSGRGQLASAGDYVLLDASGYPYPNTAEHFYLNHIRIRGNEYEQVSKPMLAWTANEPEPEALRYLLSNDLLSVNEADGQHYFTARLWGTTVSAPKDAVIVFYSVGRDERGMIRDVDFNFIVRDEFNAKYRVCERPLFWDGDDPSVFSGCMRAVPQMC